MMSLLPVGLLGLVFAALVAAIIASTASKINSVATIFTLDLYAKMKRVESRAQDAGQDADLTSAHERQLVFVGRIRSEEHTSELQSLMRISYAVFCLKKKKQTNGHTSKVIG